MECLRIVVNFKFLFFIYSLYEVFREVLLDVVLDEFFVKDIDFKMWVVRGVVKIFIIFLLLLIFFFSELLIVEKFRLVFAERDVWLVFK